MSFAFVQGRTNNHLTWVGVDATDFATRESALSAAWKIKIYGTVEGATGVNFVSSGTGSLTNDIVHIGASAAGVYHIALAKADLSDASAAWYDEYVVLLSATGAAYETFVVEGVRTDTSYMSNILSNLSAILSDTYSLLSDFRSDFQSRVPKAVATNSQLSDLHSDLRSYLVVMSDVLSDFYSDFQSRVPKRVATDSQLSDLHSDLRSYLVVMSGVQSDIYSALSDFQSDFQSRVPKRVATDSQLSDLSSDLKSAIAGVTAVVGASDISDIASAVWAAKYATHSGGSGFGSLLRKAASGVSDTQSFLVVMSDVLSDFYSDFQSRVPKRVATDSQLSDLHSDLKSYLTAMSATDSNIYSMLSDFYSDFQSRVPAVTATASDLVSQVWNYPLASRIVTLNSDDMSDIRSAIADVGGGTVTVSNISDIASAVWAAKYSVHTAASGFGSLVRKAASGVSDAQSYLVVMSGVQSDVYSLLSDLQSDFQSRVPKRVATDSQLSDLHSDLRSYLVVMSGVQSDIYSALSDFQSDFQSRVPKRVATDSQLSDLHSDLRSFLTVMSGVQSDIYSLLSDVSSDVGVMSGIQSDIYSLLSDFQSDFTSRFPTNIPELTADPGATPTWARAAALQYMWLKDSTKADPSKRYLRNAAGNTVLSATTSWDGTNSIFQQGVLG